MDETRYLPSLSFIIAHISVMNNRKAQRFFGDSLLEMCTIHVKHDSAFVVLFLFRLIGFVLFRMFERGETLHQGKVKYKIRLLWSEHYGSPRFIYDSKSRI